MRVRTSLALLLAAVLAACATPPADKYVAGAAGGGRAGAVSVGTNAAGEACTQQSGGGGTAYVYCGTWDQPSGHIVTEKAAASLDELATSSPWRASLDVRFVCGAAAPATFGDGTQARLIRCTRKIGGWPQVAFATVIGDRAYVGDAVEPALPAVERGVAVLAGRATATPAPAGPPGEDASALAARRLAARSFGSGDIGQYEQLMAAGSRANLTGDYVEAEAAYRAAAAVQRKALGQDNPNVATPLMNQAMQLSNQGRYVEAEALFAQADRMVRAPTLGDKAAQPRLLHYRALDLLNQRKADQALPLLRQAEAGYAALLPPDVLGGNASARTAALAAGGAAGLSQRLNDQELLSDPVARNALYGVVETRRNQAVALRLLGRGAESAQMAQSAADLARAQDINRPAEVARLARTEALISPDEGARQTAASLLERSARDFSRELPNSRPVAVTELLRARVLLREDRQDEALAACRAAVKLLSNLKSGVSGALIEPCLTVYARAADAAPAQRQALLAEMFEAAQQSQGSITGQQIAQASALLSENARDPRVAEAIRRRDSTSRALDELVRQRDEIDAAQREGHPIAGADLASLDRRIGEAQAAQADASAALQVASPNYGQLVQEVVRASDVQAALRPHEAFAAVTLGAEEGWTFLIRPDAIAIAPVDGGSMRMAALVKRARASMESEVAGPPPAFDAEAARLLFDSIFGRLRPQLADLDSLTVAPTGPLLSIPFGMLLEGPADPAALAGAPWLIRRMAVAHVPAAANFITLRRVAGGSRATRPWFGFGDFRPPTVAQARATFPAATCAQSAALLAALPPLPGARAELEAARRLLGAAPTDELLGPAFTAAAVQRTRLSDYRILHFATHALLPTDLACQNEPAIVTSDPAGARDADGALLTASAVARMQLDAEAVILSACNTGGPAGGAAGESLSGLARSFFFAGARSLLITHWSVSDQFTAYLVALTLEAARAHPERGLGAALRTAQLRILDESSGDRGLQAHPFFWAPLALIGDGGGTGARLAAN